MLTTITNILYLVKFSVQMYLMRGKSQYEKKNEVTPATDLVTGRK